MDRRLFGPLLASLTLGLAPFQPEPHVVEKLRWVVERGGVGMAPIDVGDLFLHGAPWVWLGVTLVAVLRQRLAPPSPPSAAPPPAAG